MSEEQFEKLMGVLEEMKDILKNISENKTKHPTHIVGTNKEKDINMEWNSLLKEKQPKNDYERIALVLYYLGEMNNKNIFKEDIVDFVRENPTNFKNIEDEKKLITTIKGTASNKAYKYIEQYQNDQGEKIYRLSMRGKKLVDILPDHPSTSKKK